MGCEILFDNHVGACFYDAVEEVAFGPIMDSKREAWAFRDWLTAMGVSVLQDCSDDELLKWLREFRHGVQASKQ